MPYRTKLASRQDKNNNNNNQSKKKMKTPTHHPSPLELARIHIDIFPCISLCFDSLVKYSGIGTLKETGENNKFDTDFV